MSVTTLTTTSNWDTTTTLTATPTALNVTLPTNATLSDNTTATLNMSTTGNSSATSTASSASSYVFTKSKPWTYTATPSKTTSGTAASQTTYVPGIVFNLTLAGSTDDQAVYSLPMTFGHETASGDYTSDRRRASSSSDWDGITGQVLNMQVDLGSSDMWVASDLCTTSSCKGAPYLYNGTDSLDTDMSLALKFQTGTVSGEIMWEQVTFGSFGIGYQAFVRGSTIQNEDLGGGNYTGLVGLALPANSLIEDAIPGTTGSSPDGATFLDNLYGGGSSAPTQRLFALSLARRDDTRTTSTLAIGTTDPDYCPSPCNPAFLPIVPQANLGRTGYLHWRLPVDGISATTFNNAQQGTGSSTQNITLGPSIVDTSQTEPLAVLDSGGVAILVGYKPYADALYAAYNIVASSDGLYRMPCTKQLAYTVTIGGEDYPIHPLDMSWTDPDDVSMATCIGAIQYVTNLGTSTDFVLGSSFLKNVYSVYQYPDQKKSSSTWQPTVGLVSLTNASQASQDFYAVRNLHQSLSTVSGSGPKTQSSAGGAAQNAASHRVMSTAIIAACSVIGFFVLAAIAFGAWWFRLRRKLGAGGVVEYKMDRRSNNGSDSDHGYHHSISTVRSRKHEETLRQKSYIDGIADYESYRSATDDSTLRLDPLAEEMDDGTHMRNKESDSFVINTNTNGSSNNSSTNNRTRASSFTNHARGSSLHQGLLATADPASPPMPFADFYPDTAHHHEQQQRRQSTSSQVLMDSALMDSPPSVARLIDIDSPPGSATHATTHFAPSTTAPRSARPSAARHVSGDSRISMSGPFPSPGIMGGSIAMSGPFPTPSRPPTVHTNSDYDYYSIVRQGEDYTAAVPRRQSRSSSGPRSNSVPRS
ncbi:uncharacterized protein EHS24_002007 [Apiotrichum porosum]|uniref:Peptidase A1 domain-containing protein n=1 Tax=Apiotrichum porosum TaxID=105984 RepID=A0A427XJJ4_9TREE|nr:uncharacterized protein EHS24_002007 [Apiotrichum porosum]RSH79075.1 hypothetical protein EHS24_002007 [Apiotrichum porosum]